MMTRTAIGTGLLALIVVAVMTHVRGVAAVVLNAACAVLGCAVHDFFRIHAPAARTVPTLLEEAAAESSWRAICRDRAEKITAMRYKVRQPDKMAAAKAKFVIREHERFRNRALSGIAKAEQAKASLRKLQKRHSWVDTYVVLLDGKLDKPNA